MDIVEEYKETKEREEEQNAFTLTETDFDTKRTVEKAEDTHFMEELIGKLEQYIQEAGNEEEEENRNPFSLIDTFPFDIEAEYKEAETIHLHTPEYQQVVQKQIPDAMPKLKSWHVGNYLLRQKFIEKMGFAYVSWEWVNPLVSWIGERKVLEVMSGKGTLAHALREKGIDVMATDDFSWHENMKWNSLWTKIRNRDALTAIERYGKKRDVLIMSWAPYNKPIGYEVLKKYHEVNPNGILLVIGEGNGGCTADGDFFYHFEEIEDESFDEVKYAYERWEGMHDYPAIGRYVKREENEEEKKD